MFIKEGKKKNNKKSDKFTKISKLKLLNNSGIPKCFQGDYCIKGKKKGQSYVNWMKGILGSEIDIYKKSLTGEYDLEKVNYPEIDALQ